MSLINDVRGELKDLDLSRKKLRSFGLVVGGVFLLISILFLFKGNIVFFYLFIIIGSFLVVSGAAFPSALKMIYPAWMSLAFVLGWIVSRIIIILLYYLIVTPTGLIAKLSGKKFIDLKFRENKSTYWIDKSGDIKTDYKKMY